MRKVIMFNMVTADGYFEGPNHELNWHVVDAEFNDFAIAQLNEVDTLVFGRKTYEMMASFWRSDSAKKDDPIVSEKMNTKDKVVFSHTIDSADWQNTTVLGKDSGEQLQELREAPGKPLLVLGSSNLCVSLLALKALDELRIMVNPVVLGKGNPLFAGLSSPVHLQLIGSQAFRSGNILLRYTVGE